MGELGVIPVGFTAGIRTTVRSPVRRHLLEVILKLWLALQQKLPVSGVTVELNIPHLAADLKITPDRSATVLLALVQDTLHFNFFICNLNTSWWFTNIKKEKYFNQTLQNDYPDSFSLKKKVKAYICLHQLTMSLKGFWIFTAGLPPKNMCQNMQGTQSQTDLMGGVKRTFIPFICPSFNRSL